MNNWEVLYRLADGTEDAFFVPAANRIAAFEMAHQIFSDMGIKPVDVSISLQPMEDL